MRQIASTLRAILLTLALIGPLLFGPLLPIRTSEVRAQDPAAGSRTPVDASGSAATSGASSVGTVELSIAQLGAGYGAGGGIRPGDWIGIQLVVHDRSTTQRSLIIRLNLLDADGDNTFQQVILPPNPDVKQRIWMYGRVPFSKGNNPQFEVTAWEVDSADQDPRTARPQRLAGTLVHTIGQIGLISPTNGLFGIVARDIGAGPLGLAQYTDHFPNDDFAPRHHELLALPAQFRPVEMPDRWMGLAPYNFIVWSSAGTGFDPNDLSESQAEALRTWVKRGGHLVIILPGSGQVWTNEISNRLFDLTPAVTVERTEGVPLLPFRPLLLSNANKAVLPTAGIVNTFVPVEGAKPEDALRILNGPDGRCIVARRLVGCGAVTLIGLDLNARGFTTIGGPEPDVFWHRVLGRRGKLEPFSEVVAAQKNNESFQFRSIRYFDQGINEIISKGQSAGLGVGLAFLCYALYWLLAGVGAWVVLRRKGWQQHAWLAFVVATGLFTAIAWGGAAVIRPRVVEGVHMTMLEHVYGQQADRARSWITLLLPWYGSASVTVGLPADQRSSAIAPWDIPANETSGGASAFPDARGYGVDARSPASVTVPTRSTVKQFQVDWSGLPPDGWEMPTPVIDDGNGGVRVGGEIRAAMVMLGEPGKAQFERDVLQGSIRHNLPGALRSTWIIWVRPQRTAAGAEFANLPIADIRVVQLSGDFAPWLPGQTLSLASLGPAFNDTSALIDGFLSTRYLPSVSNDSTGLSSRERTTPEQFMAGSLIDLMPPPDTRSAVRGGIGPLGATGYPALARRRLLHGYDLSRWATQPCVIVMGFVESLAANRPGSGAPVPYPISVGDSDPLSTREKVTGNTFIRWIYPLPDSPPAFRVQETEPAATTPGTTGGPGAPGSP
ncbi:MAG: hypothetical protein ACT4PL_04680 [Phycisphaerales bacterium]